MAKYNIRSTFQIDVPATIEIAGGTAGHPDIPQADPNYVFRKGVLSDLFTWFNLGETALYISGPTGCGKSSLIIEVAARLNIPLYNVVGHSRLETPEMVGGYKLNSNGGMDFHYGPLVKAMKEGGWFLLDEGDLVDPSTMAGTNNVAEGRPLLIPETGEKVVPASGFRYIITANSNGAGDQTGLYQGVLRQNIAFLDRFFMFEVGYSDSDIEKGILEKVTPSVPEPIRNRMVDFANSVRDLFVKGEVEVTLSTRTLCRWARIMAFQGVAAAKGGPYIIAHAFDRALGFRAETDTRKALHEVLQRHFGA